MKKPRLAFTPCDDANLPYFQAMEKSLRKFHSEEELPLLRVPNPTNDPNFWYMATPLIASKLLEEYETVIKCDADSVITGNLSHIWEGDFDIGTVLNSNPREFQNYQYQFMNIPPSQYFNNGLIVMKNHQFTIHWLRLCQSPIFAACQMREQDLLNILCLQDYKVRNLDSEGKFYGLASKGYWPNIELVDQKLILPGNEEWNKDDVEIVVIHVAGGNDPNKFKFRLYFKPEVVKYLEELTK